jgi:hypothetical protein
MAKVFNVSNQPLYLNLPGARTLKVPARSTVQVEVPDLESPIVLFHVSRGNLVVVDRDAA